MVRVLTVHNFASQSVQTVEQPTACAIAPPHRLLLALSSHCIEVRDLRAEANLLFTFPTVDQVSQLIHCLNGDYVATLETKFSRQNRELHYVRVYINWDNVATLQQSKMTSSGASLESSECGMVQPMRARIAGRVTPTTNQSELSSLEMIEIPVRYNPNSIECCQVSGNLLIQADRLLMIYAFQVKTHDISKLRFVDFEEIPVYVEMSFVPLRIAFCENYIACLNKDSMHMFKVSRAHKTNNETKDSDYCDTNFKFSESESTIDYKELLKKEATAAPKDKITVNLPSVIKSNSIIHKHSPFTYTDKEMKVTIRHNYPVEDKSHNYHVSHLIQLKLRPITIDNSLTQVAEEFKCLVVKPLYVESLKRSSEKFLHSTYRDYLAGVTCIITTMQEGFLFQFPDGDPDPNVDNCISVYPFMGPVFSVVLEGHLLHALTETGLETYTARIGHKLCRSLETVDDLNVTCPSVDELLCLIGHRQFIGIEQMLLADGHLVLLANADASPTHSVGSNSSSNAAVWTLYNLELPTPKTMFNDIAIAATAHRFTAPQTYCHLMSEGHMVLRLSLLLTRWDVQDASVSCVVPVKRNFEDLIDVYRKSCALLGDHYIMSDNEEEYVLCLPYYRMAVLSSYDVLKRFRKTQMESNVQSMKGILYYLNTVMLESKFRSPDTTIKAACKQSFIEEILAVFETHSYSNLARLVLKNKMLRDYSSSKFINVLRDQQYGDPRQETERLLALTLLYVQECNVKEAESMINHISNNNSLYQLLVENWKLLFEYSITSKHKNSLAFTEFSIVLMYTNGDTLASVFVSLVLEKRVSLHNILWMFLEYLPLRVGSDYNRASVVMQKTLEEYFKVYFANCEAKDLPSWARERSSVQEALTILVRSYMSQLQVLHIKENTPTEDKNKNTELGQIEDDAPETKEDPKQLFPDKAAERKDDFLFAELRYQYLSKMPPFQVEITGKLYEACLENYKAKESSSRDEKADLILQKLQALLCGGIISEEVVSEAHTFLRLNEHMRGHMSLKSLLLTAHEAAEFLLEACPQCLVQFGKDRFSKHEQWKCLVSSLQSKILQLARDPVLKRVCFYHKKLLKDILTHLATTLHVEALLQILPQRDNRFACDPGAESDVLDELYCYEPYVTVCRETMHANQIKKLITTTGQQLLCTLNL